MSVSGENKRQGKREQGVGMNGVEQREKREPTKSEGKGGGVEEGKRERSRERQNKGVREDCRQRKQKRTYLRRDVSAGMCQRLARFAVDLR